MLRSSFCGFSFSISGFKPHFHKVLVAHTRSDSQREATTSEALLWTGILVDLARLKLGLGLTLHSLAALLLVVLALHLLELSCQPFDLVLVLVDLGLVHVELGSHSLHLARLLLQVLLVDRKLFCDLRTWLTGQEVLELNVKLFLFMDCDILLDNFLSFLDESLLECLDLQQKLESVWISALKLPPSVIVEGILQLLREGLDLETLFLKGVTEAQHFFLVLSNLTCLGFLDLEFALVLTDLVTEQFNILKALIVLDFTLGECNLQDLDFLVQQCKLIVSTDELRAQNITLSHKRCVCLLGHLMLFNSFFDETVELGDLCHLLLDVLVSFLPVFLLHLVLLVKGFVFLLFQTVGVMLSRQSLILGIDLILQLADLVLSDTELLTQLNDFIVCEDKVLTVEITV